jgi:hypothetical protein
MSDSMLAILMGIIVVVFGTAIWVASENRERLTHWFQEHHLRDLMHHKH